MRVLILDDNPDLAKLLAMGLIARGITVTSFVCPYKALENIKEVDVLVTDYHMPEMTGLEVARRAHAQGWRGSLFIMSGHFSTITEPLELPLVQAIFQKPFSIEELLSQLRDHA